MICIYEHNCTDFATNGMGVLQPLTCEVTETLNGEWELELTHDIDDAGKWTLLQVGRILRAPVPAAMTPRMNQVSQIGGGDTGGGTVLSELTASMGSYYELVIKPSVKSLANNQMQVTLSYGVRKIAANSATYNIDAGHMWASYNDVQVLGSGGKHINWDQRQDPVGTYREYASASTVVTAGATVSVYARFYVGRVSLAHDAEINSSFRALEPPPPVSDIATVALGKTTSYETQIYRVSTQTDPLRLRSGTGTNYKILALYKKGTEVIVVDKTTSSWYEVTCPDGKHGYMAAEYLTYVRTERQQVDSQTGYQNTVIEQRQLRDQPFRIYRVLPELDKVTVYARHVYYDLMDNMIKSYEPSATTQGFSVALDLSVACEDEHPFTFYSDLATTASEVKWENINPVDAMLGEGGMTDKYGAELARDWFDVFLVSRVGNDTDVQIRERKNLTGISYDIDDTDVVTRIMPTGEDKDGNVLYLPELYLDSPNINAYDHPRWIHLPVSEAKEITDGDKQKSKDQCYTEMRAAAKAEFEKGCDLPNVTIKVDFVNCANTEEYREYAALTDIFLGDAVRVVARRIGVEVTMRMTQYTYDCLTKKYSSITLGTATSAMEGTTVSTRQLPTGGITGMKLALNSVGSGQLQSGSVGSLQIKMAAIGTAHIQEASIVRAHIAEALIDVLNVNALTAVSAKIQELAAGQITTDELYASIAMIATAQITAANLEKADIKWADIESLKAEIAEIAQAQLTTANIINANIDWAQIENLSAELAAIAKAQLTTANIINANIDWAHIESLAADVADIAKAQITAANIDEAHIDWAAVTSLTAAVAAIVQAQIGTADIDWAHIKDLATDTAIITRGVGGKLYIADLAVTEANMVNLTVGELVVKGEDGRFYAVSVDGEGNVTTTLKQIDNDDVEDQSIHGTEKLIEGSITTQVLNTQEIFAENALVKSLIAANIDVDTLFAREATINAINAMDIRGNEYLRLMVSGLVDREEFSKSIAGFEEELKEVRDIGARNLLPNTRLMQPYKLYSTATLDQDEEGFGVVTLPALSTPTYDNAIQSRNPIKYTAVQGQKVTFSFMARSDDAAAINGEVTNGLAIEFDLCDEEQYDADGNLLEPTRTKYVRIPMFSQDLSNEWKKYTWTGVVSTSLFTSGSGNVTAGTRFYVQLQNYSAGSMQVKKLKLELGAIATDWSPAPEDISTDIDAQGDLITGLQQSFADMEVRQNEITATVGEMREANEETYNTLKEYVDTTVSQSASGVKIDIVKMLEQGMDADGNIIAYKTTTGFSFDNTGLHISETGNGNITNDLTPTGMTVKRSGEDVLVADVSGVQATDVTVKNFLILGLYSRFEDYATSTDDKRTGCYYTGP